MPAERHVLGLHDLTQICCLFVQFLLGCLRIPLERGLRLRHKAGGRRRNLDAARAVWRRHAPAIGDVFAQLRHLVKIRVGLGRQTHHKVQLDVVPAALKGIGARREQIFFCDIFVDDIAQTLTARLRRKGQAALAHLLHALHQLHAEGVCAQRRQRQADAALFANIQQIIGELRQLGIVTGRQ